MSKFDVVVAGHICCDITPAFPAKNLKMEEIFVPGKLVNMNDVTVSTGGPVSNTGIALIKLGIGTKLMGKVGNDFFGEGVLSMLKKIDAAEGMRVVPGESTSYTIAIVVPGYDRIFLHCTGANDTFCADDIDYEIVKEAKLFHFGYPPLMRRMFERDGAELVEIFRRVKTLGVTTSLDMSLPDVNSPSGKADWDSILRRLLPYVDLFLPSVEETMFMIARDEFDALNRNASGGDLLEALDINRVSMLGETLKRYGAKIVAIKCGVRGFYTTTADRDALSAMGAALPRNLSNWSGRELYEESFHVEKVASATGSGDCAIAGFLSAYLRGYDIEEAIRIACAVGGENVQTYDALSGIRTWDETLALIPNWRKNRLDIAGGYFTYDDQKCVWVGRSDGKYACEHA